MARFWAIDMTFKPDRTTNRFFAAHVWLLKDGFGWVNENDGMDGVFHGHIARGHFRKQGSGWKLENENFRFELSPYQIEQEPCSDEENARRYLCALNEGIESELEYVDLADWPDADVPRLELNSSR